MACEPGVGTALTTGFRGPGRSRSKFLLQEPETRTNTLPGPPWVRRA